MTGANSFRDQNKAQNIKKTNIKINYQVAR